MKRSISILIPTHNRCHILKQTLTSLTKINIIDDFDIELIVIANACTDDTLSVVNDFAKLTRFPTKCIVEETPGLNVARNRAAKEAHGEILAYLDDDVWVETNWLIGLAEVYNTFNADVAGGRVVLWWDAVSEPVWMSKTIETMLSGSDHGTEVFKIGPTGKLAMIGANFSFKKEVWNQLGGFRIGLDRKGKSLLGGGEVEFLQRARSSGFSLYYASNACVKHWVAPNRIGPSYLMRLSFDFGRTSIFLKDNLSKFDLAVIVACNPFRSVVSLFGMIIAFLKRQKSPCMDRMLAVLKSLGKSYAALQVLLGKHPAKS